MRALTPRGRAAAPLGSGGRLTPAPRKTRASATERQTRPQPTPRSLAALIALAFLSALWALLLWAQLVRGRSSGTTVCALGDDTSCGALWDSAFASSVHAATGIPLAGWGLAWGVVAFTLPLLVLLARAEGQRDGGLVSAVRVAAGAGALAVLLLAGVSAAARALCLGCLVTYILMALYGVIALYGWRHVGLTGARRGLALFALLTAAAALLLLYPGLRTPRGTREAGRQAIADLPQRAARGTGDAARDRELQEFVASLSPQLQQALSDSLSLYRKAPALDMTEPRFLVGAPEAPVRITEFTDVLCEHCADLHRTLEYLQQYTPPRSFSIEPRQFPLDGRCNPRVARKGETDVRCLAAKLQICLEGSEKAFAFSGALFEKQRRLSEEKVYELAAPYRARSDLERCVESPRTRARLEEDIAQASRHDFEGTPLVLVNGRKGTSFGPFLYAMILTGGAASHAAFQALPAPNPNPHVH